MIRGNIHKCPFGLNIPLGCKSAGGCLKDSGIEAAKLMQSVLDLDSEGSSEVINDNIELLFLIEDPKPCIYADKIMKDGKTVDCKYDEGRKDIALEVSGINPSNEYARMMIGEGAKHQYGFPEEYGDYYSDNNNTNIYYGIYSLIG